MMFHAISHAVYGRLLWGAEHAMGHTMVASMVCPMAGPTNVKHLTRGGFNPFVPVLMALVTVVAVLVLVLVSLAVLVLVLTFYFDRCFPLLLALVLVLVSVLLVLLVLCYCWWCWR